MNAIFTRDGIADAVFVSPSCFHLYLSVTPASNVYSSVLLIRIIRYYCIFFSHQFNSAAARTCQLYPIFISLNTIISSLSFQGNSVLPLMIDAILSRINCIAASCCCENNASLASLALIFIILVMDAVSRNNNLIIIHCFQFNFSIFRICIKLNAVSLFILTLNLIRISSL